MKLRAKTDEVIKYLKKGKKIYCRIEKVYGSTFQVVYQATIYWIERARGNRVRIHHSTIYSLQRKGIIDSKYTLVKL